MEWSNFNCIRTYKEVWELVVPDSEKWGLERLRKKMFGSNGWRIFRARFLQSSAPAAAGEARGDSLGIVTLGKLAVESIPADAGAVKLPHDETVFLDEIVDGLLPVLYLIEPLVLINVPVDDVPLGIQDFPKVGTLLDHG
jgi:hypothetical protein